jgi:hypothetical protein
VRGWVDVGELGEAGDSGPEKRSPKMRPKLSSMSCGRSSLLRYWFQKPSKSKSEACPREVL